MSRNSAVSQIAVALILASLIVGGTVGYLGLQPAGNEPIGTGGGWLTDWSYRKSHTINYAAGAGTFYQKQITVHYGVGSDSDDDVYCTVGGVAHCKMDFGDIRFTDDDGTTLLDCWMESKVDSDNAVFWVEVADDLSTVAATVYVYYGKADATTTSNVWNTFLAYDNFDDNSINATIWATHVQNGGSIAETGGEMKHVNDGDWSGENHYTATNVFSKSSSYYIQFKIRYPSCYANGGDSHYVALFNTASVAWSDGYYDQPYVSGVYAASIDVGSGGWTYDTTWNLIIYSSGTYDLVRISGTSYMSNVIGGTIANWANLASTYAIDFGSATYASHHTYWDNTLIRKYAKPEPAHGAWGSEETPTSNRSPDAPTLNNPVADYRFDPSASVTFSWTFSDPNAGDYQTAYQFQLDDNSSFSSPIIIDSGKVSSMDHQTTQTLPSTVGLYYWRVKTWDSSNAEGPYCTGRTIIVNWSGRITRVQGNARGTSTSQTSCPVTLTSAPISGNVLIATFSSWGYTNKPIITSITQTGVTWSKVVSVGGTGGYMNGEIWFGVVGAGASTSVTVNMGSGSGGYYRSVCNICEYSGVRTTGFTDVTSTAMGGGQYVTNCLTGTTATTTQASELWIGNIATRGYSTGSYSLTAPQNGFTLLDGVAVYTYNEYYSGNTYLEYFASSTGAAWSGATAGRGVYYDGCIATFKANRAPDAPTLSSPVANARFNPSASVTFSWTFSDPDAGDYQTAYQFQLADTPIFSPPLIDTGKVSSASQQTTQTLPATVHTYYWHVKTWDSYGADGSYGGLGRVIIVDQIKVAVMGAPEITGGLVLYSSMNEGAGTSALDLSAYNNAGMVYGATWVDGKYGKALSFDGVGNYVEYPSSSSLEINTNKVSISCWVLRQVDSGGYERLVTKSAATPGVDDEDYWLQITNLDVIQVGVKQVSTALCYANGNTTIPLNTWMHICGTYDGTVSIENAFHIYINGINDALSYHSAATVTMRYQTTTTLDVGRYGDWGSWYYGFHGLVDEVRIYNRALTAAEVQQLYRVGNSRLNVGEQAVLAAKLVYASDNTLITTGAFTLNGLSLTSLGLGSWTTTDSKGSVQSVTYNSLLGTEGAYSLTSVDQNGASATVIWDRIKLTFCGILNNVVDTRTGGKVWYQAVYEYGSTSFSSASGTLYLNNDAMNWTSDRWTYDFPYQMSGNQKVFQVTSFTETSYGLTTLNNAAGDLVLNWATMAITINKP